MTQSRGQEKMVRLEKWELGGLAKEKCVICLLAEVVSKKGQVDKSIAMLNKEIYCSLRYIFEFGCFKAAHLLEHQGLQGFCSKV